MQSPSTILIYVILWSLIFVVVSSRTHSDIPNTEFMVDMHSGSGLEYNSTMYDALIGELNQFASKSQGSRFSQPECPRLYIRREFRDLSPEEWDRFKRALLKMMEGDDKVFKENLNGELPSPLSIGFWTRLHLASVPHAHGTPQFLPWHRVYIFKFEQALRSIDPEVTLPYWDWSLDSSNPSASPIWSTSYLGTLYSERGDCINFPALTVPQPHCLKRRRIFSFEFFSSRIKSAPFYSSKTFNAIIKDTTLEYDKFRSLIELAPHNIVHTAIGGSDGDMSFMFSPNDPIFWLHHSFIDKQWADHQLLVEKSKGKYFFAHDYNGINPATGSEVTLEDRLRPFEETVGEAIDFTAAPFCYIYAPPKKAMLSFSTMESPFIRRLPEPIPESWLKMHKFDIGKVREVESILAAIMSRETEH